MAIMGMNYVETINEVVETILEFPMSGGTSGLPAGVAKPSAQTPVADNVSVYYRAEQFVDRENRRIQAWGWPENTRSAVKYTAGVSTKEIEFAASGDVLKVRAAGPDSHRNLVLRVDGTDTKLYDADNGSFDITAVVGGTVYLDITELLDYEYLPPHLQDVIVARAKWTFQRRMQGNMQLDQSLMQEYMQAEASSSRNKADGDDNFNIAPTIPGAGPATRAGQTAREQR